MNKAVFVDRDGVINALKHYPDWGEFESPRVPEDMEIYPYVAHALRVIKEAGFFIFVITNQPSYAKGKTSMENLIAVAKRLEDYSREHGNLIDKYYCCYHHPKAVIHEYAVECGCRKPGTLFPERAIEEFLLDAEHCYFIGDQDSDMFCGEAVGFQTIKINNPHSENKSGKSAPDYLAGNLLHAALIIRQRERVAHGFFRLH